MLQVLISPRYWEKFFRRKQHYRLNDNEALLKDGKERALLSQVVIDIQGEQEVNANRMISYHSVCVVTLRERRHSRRLRELFSFSTV